MKIINIPSVSNERCITILKFQEKGYDIIPWALELECKTPTLNAKLKGHVENDHLKWFINDLEKVEKNRKGECQFYDEWGFSLTIRSIDSVGHFVVHVAIWSQGKTHGEKNRIGDSMDIAYEIEPSLLVVLLKKFKELYS